MFSYQTAHAVAMLLLKSRATRQVSGRKSDVLDCQWIRQLMRYGLLKGAFRPGKDGILYLVFCSL